MEDKNKRADNAAHIQPLEEEKRELERRSDIMISDELKRSIDLAHRLSAKEPSPIRIKTVPIGYSED